MEHLFLSLFFLLRSQMCVEIMIIVCLLLFSIATVYSVEGNFSILEDEIDYGNIIMFLGRFLVRYACLVMISSNDKFTLDIFKYNAYYLQSSLILYKEDFKIHLRREVSKEYFIIHNDVKKIEEMIINIRDHLKSNTLLFIVITRSYCDNSTNEHFKEIFNVTWSLYLKKVVLLVQEICDISRENDVYTFDPFLNQTYKFNMKQSSDIQKQLNSKNYHKYLLKASLFQSVPTTVKLDGYYIGIDPMVIQTIKEALNVSIITHEPYDQFQYGYRAKNGSTGGAIKELYSKEVDIAFNQVFIKEYNAPELEFTKVIFRDSLCVIVPKSELIPNWTAIFYTFPKEVWIVMFFTVTAGIFALYVIRRFRATLFSKMIKKKHTYDYSWSTVFLDVNQICFSAAHGSLFSSRYYERIFIGSILLYVLIINTLFQSSLVTVITHHRRYPEINTLQDLATSGYYISTSSPGLTDTFKGRDNPYIKELNNRFRVIGINNSYYKAYLSRESKQNYLDYLKKAQATNTHVVKECPRTFLLAYLTLKDAHFRKDFNDVIQRIVAAGLVEKWYDTVKINASLALPKNECSIETDPLFPRPFSIIDLQTSFFILLTGLFGSLATFYIEMCLHSINKSKLNKNCFSDKK